MSPDVNLHCPFDPTDPVLEVGAVEKSRWRRRLLAVLARLTGLPGLPGLAAAPAAAATSLAAPASALAALALAFLALIGGSAFLVLHGEGARGEALRQVDLGADGVGEVRDNENVLDVVVAAAR